MGCRDRKVVAGPFKGHTDIVWTVCFSPDGKQIASGSRDKNIRIWDAQTGALLVGPLSGHTEGVDSIAFSGDGTRIASGSDDNTVSIWNAKSGRLVRGPLEGHQHWIGFVHSPPIQGGSFQHQRSGMSVFGMQILELWYLGLRCSTRKVPSLWCSHPIAHFPLSHLMGSG